MTNLATPPFPPITVTQALAAEAMDYTAFLSSGDFAGMEARLDALAATSGHQGELDYRGAVGGFNSMSYHLGGNPLENIRRWRAARPESPYPTMMEVLYWQWVAWEFRGGDVAGNVSDAQWQAAHYAIHAAFACAFDLFTRHGAQKRLWPVAHTLLSGCGGFEEPAWVSRWLDKGVAPKPGQLPEKPEGVDEMLANYGLDAFTPPPLPAQLPPFLEQCRPLRKEAREKSHSQLWFWMRVVFALTEPGLEAAMSYADFLRPRWGGSWEEQLAFADSPECARFNEEEKGYLRYTAWSDELDSFNYGLDDDDPRLVRQAIAKAEAMLQRPLAENLRGRVHRALAVLCQEAGRPAEEILAHYRITAPLNYVDVDQLRSAWEFWLAHDRQGHWITQMASTNKLELPQAAALYGFLCERGWAGQSPSLSIAHQWYDYAAKLQSPLPYPGNCPFEPLHTPLEENGEMAAALDSLHLAADRGYCRAQFKLGWYYQLADSPQLNLEKAWHYTELAARQTHETAMSNLVSIAGRCADQAGLTPAQSRAWLLISFDEAVRLLNFYQEEENRTEISDEVEENMVNFVANNLLDFPNDRAIVDKLLPVTQAWGNAGHIWSMCALSRFYATEKHPRHDYKEAVRWCEGVRRLAPDDEYVQGTIEIVEGTSFIKTTRYTLTAGRFKASDLPGQVDDTF